MHQNIFMSINSFIYALKLELFLVCDILIKANILHFSTKNDNITHYLGMSYYVNFLGGLGSNEFHIELRFGTYGSWKNENPGGRFRATS